MSMVCGDEVIGRFQIHIRLEDLAVDATEIPSDAYGKLCTNDLKRDISIYAAKMATSTYLIAPAEVLGLNHCQTSFPSSSPTKAILCTLYGHSVDGRRRIEEVCHYLAIGGVIWGIDRLRGHHHSTKSPTSITTLPLLAPWPPTF